MKGVFMSKGTKRSQKTFNLEFLYDEKVTYWTRDIIGPRSNTVLGNVSSSVCRGFNIKQSVSTGGLCGGPRVSEVALTSMAICYKVRSTLFWGYETKCAWTKIVRVVCFVKEGLPVFCVGKIFYSWL